MRRILARASILAFLGGCAAEPTKPAAPSLEDTSPRRDEPAFPSNEWLARPPTTNVAALDPAEARAMDSELEATILALAASPTPWLPLPLVGNDPNSYFTVKGGVLYPSESDLDSGYIVNAAYGHYFTRLLSLEFEGGYMAPDADASSVDLYAVPLMINGRVNVPIWILELYGGVGVGTMYYNIDAGQFDDDGWLAAGSAFVGADLGIFDKLTGGIEVKYYVTEDLQHSNDNLDSLAVMITLGWRF